MNKFISVVKRWLPFAAVITLLCGIVYTVGQQNYRQSANDPQYEMAEGAAYSLSYGADAKSLVAASQPVDISRSLSPYLIIYDASENVVASNAVLDGKIPKLPKGVLDYVRKKGEDMITWQPRPGIRQALVISKTEGSNLYFAAAGRSMHKVEERIGLLAQQVAFGWIISMGVLFVVILCMETFLKRKS